MIHSLAGGKIQNLQHTDFVKVQIITAPFANDIYWYIACGLEKVGSIVVVPLGKNNTLVQGRVLRIDKNISNQVAPVPMSRAKKVVRVVE